MADYGPPIYLTMNDKPRAILSGMDELPAKRQNLLELSRRRKWFPLVLFLAGFGFPLLDLLVMVLGYRMCVFSLVTPVCWIAALVMWIALRRNRMPVIPPLYQTVREILYTLRDDVDPKRTYFGHLDLSGTRLPTKVARETSNALGQVTQQFRDEWFSLKTKLYDGNALRLSAVQRDKVRKGYWKRSAISGKMKWKAEKFKGSLQELKVRISVNPEAYEIADTQTLPVGMTVGAYTIQQISANGGIIDLVAGSYTPHIEAVDVLSVLKAAYGLLKRKATL
ncbi:MAG: hypothetical protein JXB15_11640 [Anaerolineales bacterium]|nr:hypothetical protein [Anaerolineales bacterium]